MCYLYFLIVPAIDDIINQIKGGRFTLKQTDVSLCNRGHYFCIRKLRFSSETIRCRNKGKKREKDDRKRKARRPLSRKC